ncbi:DUF4235 domain-containing protein [Bifidobacterium choerinum]|uniref:Membrane associated protein n=1 Tax=Bifidobacterium choerinum TaxID=35760 RepID=A0A087A6L8_9BIFI|nr:DUF4235 domain-containing protein [Bifidobacterium choerinum]KFI54418.1 membrane associated protein [Bifidobacterium choerinum]
MKKHQHESASADAKLTAATNAIAGERSDLDATTDRTVAALNNVNDKVTAMREARMADPDTLGDKVFRMAFPAVVGLIGGKVFSSVWNLVTAKIHPNPDDDAQDRQQGLVMSMLFAAASAAFGTLLTDVSTKGVQKIITRLQRRRG